MATAKRKRTDVGFDVDRAIDKLHPVLEPGAVIDEVGLEGRMPEFDFAEPFGLVFDEDGSAAAIEAGPEGRIVAHAEDQEIYRRLDGAGDEEQLIGVHLDAEPGALAHDVGEFNRFHFSENP